MLADTDIHTHRETLPASPPKEIQEQQVEEELRGVHLCRELDVLLLHLDIKNDVDKIILRARLGDVFNMFDPDVCTHALNWLSNDTRGKYAQALLDRHLAEPYPLDAEYVLTSLVPMACDTNEAIEKRLYAIELIVHTSNLLERLDIESIFTAEQQVTLFKEAILNHALDKQDRQRIVDFLGSFSIDDQVAEEAYHVIDAVLHPSMMDTFRTYFPYTRKQTLEKLAHAEVAAELALSCLSLSRSDRAAHILFTAFESRSLKPELHEHVRSIIAKASEHNPFLKSYQRILDNENKQETELVEA